MTAVDDLARAQKEVADWRSIVANGTWRSAVEKRRDMAVFACHLEDVVRLDPEDVDAARELAETRARIEAIDALHEQETAEMGVMPDDLDGEASALDESFMHWPTGDGPIPLVGDE